MRCRVSGRPVLRGLDLSLEEGHLILIQGQNGAGKTTLLRLLAGLARPLKGEVLWFGEPSLASRPDLRSRLGFMTHEILLYEDLSAHENLMLFAELYHLASPRRRVMGALEAAGLWGRRDDPPRKYSRGMRARLAFARTLIHHPSLLLLDEPTSGLDETGQDWVRKTLEQHLKKGGSAVVTAHQPDPWRNLTDQAYVLEKGVLRALGFKA